MSGRTGGQPSGLPWSWGDTGATVAAQRPPGFEGRHAVRGVRVAAPPEVVFRWLTQLTVAPYSYDLLDNRGRRSPRHLVDGIELVPGSTVMEIFRATAVEPGRRLDLELAHRGSQQWFGRIAVIYRTEPAPEGDGTVLRCDMYLTEGRGLLRWRDLLLAWGDVVMMRKQLLTLKELSERPTQGFPGRGRGA